MVKPVNGYFPRGLGTFTKIPGFRSSYEPREDIGNPGNANVF